MIRKAVAKITSKLTDWIMRLIKCIVGALLVSTIMATSGIVEIVLVFAMSPLTTIVAVVVILALMA